MKDTSSTPPCFAGRWLKLKWREITQMAATWRWEGKQKLTVLQSSESLEQLLGTLNDLKC